MTTGKRPTPEEMLWRARREETERRRGRLKVFFGMAPGVGKTYAMLEAARARQARGDDAVIGWIETHGRPETEALAAGLERLPPRELEYRGVPLREFDIEAALRRRPALLLMDELAHSNAAGSRHARRWQDVLELLDAGIDVLTTLNVQHLESLNDVVAQITRVVVRETVPDSVFEMADEMELVDLGPDDLIRRLQEGKVYIPAQASLAMEHFFRKGNLIALRELALRRTAERVDAQMARWKEDQGIGQPWPTRERILVAVGPAPRSADLIRAAYRMATRLGAPWIALSVETPAYRGLPERERERATAHLALAERLGAETLVVDAERVSDAVLQVARQRNVSRILVGKPKRAGWRDRLRRSGLDELIRGSGAIDVLVTAGDPEAEPRPQPAGDAPPGRPADYLWALLVVVAATVFSLLTRPFFELADDAMIFLLGVVFVSGRFSRGPSLAAAFASVAALDFFCVRPFFTLRVADLRHVVTFGVMLVVALVVSHLTQRVRRQAEAAREREARTAALYAMSRDFASRRGLDEIARTAALHVREQLGVEGVLLVAGAAGALDVRAGGGTRLAGSERDLAVARWVLEHGRPAGRGTETLPGGDGWFLPLAGAAGTLGVLGIDLGEREEPLSPSQRQLLEMFASQTAVAVERTLLGRQAEEGRVAVETERIRNALLSGISHDLRTPLAAVTGAATSLLHDESRHDPAVRHELLETIRDEADRLSRLVGDLLDLTRLESGAIEARKEWYPIEDVIGSALGRLEARLQDREVRTTLPDTLLLVPLDPILIEQVLINLLDNALKYTPAGTPIDLAVHGLPGEIQVDVVDRGPGVPPGQEESIFEKFQRAAAGGTGTGSGLGLAVCRAIARIHGGRIWMENRPGGGAAFHLALPLDREPPGLEEPPPPPSEMADPDRPPDRTASAAAPREGNAAPNPEPPS
jgi:two-component system, OmpR family, sensor histidine kinase KdpD